MTSGEHSTCRRQQPPRRVRPYRKYSHGEYSHGKYSQRSLAPWSIDLAATKATETGAHLPLYFTLCHGSYAYCEYAHTDCAGDMWTAEEDEAICDAVERLGQKWAPIAALLPGRSPNAVRNRFLRVLRPSQLAAQAGGRG